MPSILDLPVGSDVALTNFFAGGVRKREQPLASPQCTCTCNCSCNCVCPCLVTCSCSCECSSECPACSCDCGQCSCACQCYCLCDNCACQCDSPSLSAELFDTGKFNLQNTTSQGEGEATQDLARDPNSASLSSQTATQVNDGVYESINYSVHQTARDTQEYETSTSERYAAMITTGPAARDSMDTGVFSGESSAAAYEAYSEPGY